MRQYDLGLASVELTEESLAGYDAVIIATDHSSYDYEFILRHARLVIDTRNSTGNLTLHRDKIVCA
ncbi:MAG TPA: nucleotide sugar dehydrogenase, partial [Terriglobia bacterium]|nr:nucleotide sugar dehydrogenase [Terriglobia bacterium]